MTASFFFLSNHHLSSDWSSENLGNLPFPLIVEDQQLSLYWWINLRFFSGCGISESWFLTTWHMRKSSLVPQTVKHLSTMQETRVWSLGWEDALEKEMATHSRIIAWKIPWTEEPSHKESDTTEQLHFLSGTVILTWTFLVPQTVKHLSTVWEIWVQSLGWEDPLEKEMAIHSSTIAWKMPWTEEPDGLQSMGSQSQTRQSN